MKIFKDEKGVNTFKIGVTLLSFAFVLVVLGLILPNIWSGAISFINVLQPFIMGFVIVYFLNPLWVKLMTFMNRSKLFVKRPVLTRALSIVFIYIVLILLLISVVVFIIPEISESVTTVTADLPALFSKFKVNVENIMGSRGDIANLVTENLYH